MTPEENKVWVFKNGDKVGIRGLNNLGNTCYLNSALQCLHKTFEINEKCKNAMGSKKAESTRAFLTMFEELSKNVNKSFAPRRVKNLISEFNPLFSGYDQHDSGEAMGTILRMIH